ncbi:MarR family winged helix-turn-helix transcriptional regulator [Acetobacter sp.]|uniref:MarR family winged helix-turn-helix transcriptional regulator n=1 Tax=Acetobacter sp. TaxID=440 RepID=UPI0025BEC6A0|nr:MarR family transcriptional regulator [Acetobacter sp.]MCH4091586.1 MarR family transcriptional regulator [Acetobacter sp.]MCI1301150.1 MarR family transcriptional regulator [Acetobacter sp.]MCI1317446.1 MarR family transcriptional regulator [Acetobacter sp.]
MSGQTQAGNVASQSTKLLRRRFSYRLVRLATQWRREIDLDLRQFGLTDATWRPLYYLRVLPGPVRQTDLARAMLVEAQSLVRLLDVLERRGLIHRDTDPDDRRSKFVTLTDAGVAMGETVLGVADDVALRFLEGVSDDALKECEAVFDQVWSGRGHDRASAETAPKSPAPAASGS